MTSMRNVLPGGLVTQPLCFLTNVLRASNASACFLFLSSPVA